MTPPLTAAQLRRDLADAHRLQTVSVAQTVAERAIQAVEARDALLRDVRDEIAGDEYVGFVALVERINAVTGEAP